MPSLRVLSVVVLIGMGAGVAAVGGLSAADRPDKQLRGSLVESPPPAITATATEPATPFDVAAENQRPGTAGWRISPARGNRPGLRAYAAAVSVTAGQSVPLAVDGQGTVQVRAFRIGWYGGAGARQQWRGTLRARPEQGSPALWQARGLADTTGWPEGHYLLRLDQPGATGKGVSRYLPLTVRSPDTQGKVLVLSSPLTWEAENTFGSTSAGGSGVLQRTVSFNRPYADGYGSGGFLADETGLVQQAERTGHQLAYATDYDVARNPALVSAAAAVVVGGDSRFWTPSLRSAVQDAGTKGTNLAFFGAASGSLQVRVLADGRRIQIPGGQQPSGSPRLTGERPSCAAPATQTTPAGWKVSSPAWIGYRNTGVHSGDVLPGLVADGADRASTGSAASPAPLQVLSFTQIQCGATAAVQSAVYAERPSGAAVFTAGTGRWACAIGNACTDDDGVRVDIPEASRKFVAQVTRNVISVFAGARAGSRHPAKNTAGQFTALR